jgi:alcohol dehydrogenase YqhD (iron-dependent ADH family)
MTAGVGRIAMPLHALEHALSVRQEIPHGAGLAALLPGWLAFQIGSFSGRLAAFGRAVFAIDAADEAQAAALTVTAIESFLEAGGSRPRLSEWAITIEQIPELTAHCREQAAIWRLRGLPPDLIEAALRYCLKG